MVFNNYGDYQRWFNKADRWQLQALRADKLGTAWLQQDNMLDKSYRSYEDLAAQIEIVANDFKSFKQYMEYQKLQDKAIGE